MTQPSLPQQVLVAQANALGVGERSLPLAVPPISQSLVSVANALPLGALPALPGPGAAGGGLSLPVLGNLMPLGGNILAQLVPAAPLAPVPSSRLPVLLPTGRTGMG